MGLIKVSANSNPIKIDINKINNEKYNFDLRGFINKEILDLNVKNIENIEMDTFEEKEFFYSHEVFTTSTCINFRLYFF